MNYGLKIDEIKQQDFLFGDAKLGDSPINPDANWSGFLPDVEVQNLNGIEPYACVSFTTLNCVEILERFTYGATDNWSDRFLATISGTKEQKGNSPQAVAEMLRKQGCVKEQELPFDSSVTTFDKFYAPIKSALLTMALAFKAEFSFGHSYVPSNAEAMMEALTYSPLGVSVSAWYKDENGLYYRPQGMTDNHFTVCYGYVKDKYWLIFDSYVNDGTAHKKLRWDSIPMQMKRFTLNRQISVPSAWERFIKLLKEICGIT